jgi:hypothetical protein
MLLGSVDSQRNLFYEKLLRNCHCECFSAKQSLACEKIARLRLTESRKAGQKAPRDDKWFLTGRMIESQIVLAGRLRCSRFKISCRYRASFCLTELEQLTENSLKSYSVSRSNSVSEFLFVGLGQSLRPLASLDSYNASSKPSCGKIRRGKITLEISAIRSWRWFRTTPARCECGAI